MSIVTERGFVFVSILLTLMVLGGMYIYFSNLPSEVPLTQVRTRTGQMACRAALVSAERTVATWKATHPQGKASVAALEKQGVQWPRCPDGGQFAIEGDQVLCTLHSSQAEIR